MRTPGIIGAACLVLAGTSLCIAKDLAPSSGLVVGQPGSVAPQSLAETNRPVSFQLKPTAIAPSGAAGWVEVKSPTSLAVHLSQLGPGKYDLQAIHRSDGAIQRLGTITIVDPTLSPSRQATDNKKEASANPESVHVETDVSITLPHEIAAKDIGRIQLVGDGGNAVLDSLAR